MKTASRIIQVLLALAAIAFAGFVSWMLLKTAPDTEPEDEQVAAKIVQVMPLESRDERIIVTAWGTVIPAREVTIRPQVSGRIIEQHEALIPGGLLEQNASLLRIDPSDYELAVTEATAELEEARFEFDTEQGRQVVAKREWEQLRRELSGIETNPSLALREPHLKRAEALVEKAENAIARARLDLQRTEILVPFNSVVIEESVESGQLVENGDEICRLVGTDAFWVRATLPISELKWIQLPRQDKHGSTTEVYLDSGHESEHPWKGEVIRLLGDLEAEGRMARILVEVEDPLGRGSESSRPSPLLLNSYVRVDIEAGKLSDVISIPRPALREGNRLWLVGDDKRVRIAEPEILWTRENTVLVPASTLRPGEQLIVSELKAALPGMKVSPRQLK